MPVQLATGTRISRSAFHPDNWKLSAKFVAAATTMPDLDGIKTAVTWSITVRHGDRIIELITGVAMCFADAIEAADAQYRAVCAKRPGGPLVPPFLSTNP